MKKLLFVLSLMPTICFSADFEVSELVRADCLKSRRYSTPTCECIGFLVSMDDHERHLSEYKEDPTPFVARCVAAKGNTTLAYIAQSSAEKKQK